MFELSFLKKYLTPKRKQLSVSLIALLSIAVITVVVWLVTVFLSITEGIEKNWLDKLTALNAPVRVIPTREYFNSYYYNVDKYSELSGYALKTLGQKAAAEITDPYNPEFDEQLPLGIASPDRLANGELCDPVKALYAALEELKPSYPGLLYQDIEMSGALLYLDLVRKDPDTFYTTERQSHLTNVSYLASFPEKNPSLSTLLLEPSLEDLNHLLYRAKRAENTEEIDSILSHTHIQAIEPSGTLFAIQFSSLPDNTPFAVEPYFQQEEISHVILPVSAPENPKGYIEKRGNHLFFKQKGQGELPLAKDIPLFCHGQSELQVEKQGEGLSFFVSGRVQNIPILAEVEIDQFQVKRAKFETTFSEVPSPAPIWSAMINGQGYLPSSGKEAPILLAKNFRENGVRIGDRGYIAYSAFSITATKEHHIPVYVAGFYDPGIMAVGNKCILVPPHITEAINASESSFTLDRSESNQFFVWLSKRSVSKEFKAKLIEKLKEKEIDAYWKVETFYDYEFAKDLMQQFESDKYLFSLVGLIILLVACTNIISLLILLVSDKKKEIGILMAMGAKKRSIGAIFALCGGALGLLSCTAGIALAFFTLKNIDSLVYLLSSLQGHEAFNPQFFGTSLPREISQRALIFAAIVTPILALIAGLVPALKASRLNPCETLRSE